MSEQFLANIKAVIDAEAEALNNLKRNLPADLEKVTQ